MASTGDIYQVVAEGSLATVEEWSMRFYYEVATVTTGFDAENVADNLVAGLFDLITDVMHQDHDLSKVSTINLDDITDVNVTNPSLSGEFTGSRLPLTSAVGFRSQWPGRGFNRASKRLPLGNASWNDANGSLTAVARTACAPIAESLGQVLTLGGGTLTPITALLTYSAGELVSWVKRADVSGDWELNVWFTTQKSRAVYSWVDPNAT